MSKVNAMQAMREARYAAAKAAAQVKAAGPSPQAGSPARQPTASPQQPPAIAASLSVPEALDLTTSRPAAPAPALLDVAPEPVEALCGHRSMNNRLCRRPAGHPEKNHRYG